MISCLVYVPSSVTLIQTRSQKASCRHTQTFTAVLHIVLLDTALYVSFQSWPGPYEQPTNHSCLPSQWKARSYLVASLVAQKVSLPGALLSICCSLPGAVPSPNLCLPFEVTQSTGWDYARMRQNNTVFSGDCLGF